MGDDAITARTMVPLPFPLATRTIAPSGSSSDSMSDGSVDCARTEADAEEEDEGGRGPRRDWAAMEI